MKKIDENTIQVIIGQDDLDQRGITMLDLLGNQKQIEDFFYSILDEVDTEHQFRKNDSVTFQALPTPEGLELLISKNNGKNASLNDELSQMISQQLKGHDGDVEDKTADSNSDMLQNDKNNKLSFVVRFHSFEDFLALASILNSDGINSDLYVIDHNYILIIENNDYDITSTDQVLDYKAICSEYGTVTDDMPALVREHGKVIMTGSAIQTAQHYFK